MKPDIVDGIIGLVVAVVFLIVAMSFNLVMTIGPVSLPLSAILMVLGIGGIIYGGYAIIRGARARGWV